ncbi:MAG TPA: winged helix-turn-helix domain-containing protein [Candidatus Nanoarchaeia archaeon]|nr:winged helix-turn-helix domain-containing protein [Candidatus Nanoarchaeia archaeon]
MAKKRDRLEIIYTILSIIKERDNSIKKTPLLRYTNISSQSFGEYYNELVDKDLIREVSDRKGKVYVTLTDKGFNFLSKYSLIRNFIDEFEL